MDMTGTMMQGAEAMERAVKLIESCRTPADIRSGFLKVAQAMEGVPGQETLVRSMRIGAQPGGLSDEQLVLVRDQILGQFPNNARFLRESAGQLRGDRGAKWWRFWK